jgi:hypothetical protein
VGQQESGEGSQEGQVLRVFTEGVPSNTEAPRSVVSGVQDKDVLRRKKGKEREEIHSPKSPPEMKYYKLI